CQTIFKEFKEQNIRNDTAIILASIIQREAANEEEMPLIAGIIWNRLLKPMPLQIVREGMRDAVTYGSSAILNSLPVEVAAKTGTAQTSRKGYYHNWVTVFAPYDDPQIVLTVMIEDIEGMRAVILPVAKEILEWYFTREEEI
ncbi:unnamed protein product, partial [marine sediment metagenome]